MKQQKLQCHKRNVITWSTPYCLYPTWGRFYSLRAPLFLQLAAQVLEDLKDEDIGFALLDAKKEKSVAKTLGKPDLWKGTPRFISQFNRKVIGLLFYIIIFPNNNISYI